VSVYVIFAKPIIMNLNSFKTVSIALIGAVAMSSCINSKEAYEKSKLSGFVAEQTQDILKKNPPQVDFSGVEAKISTVDMKVKAMDENNAKAQAVVAKLEDKLKTIETLEKESKAEFERSNTAVIFFDVNSSVLSPSAMQEMFRWKSALDIASSAYSFEINVFTSADKTGSDATNDRLRARRAESVRKFLTEVLGVKAKINITTVQPAHSQSNTLDRRAVISIDCK